jgi:integrase
VDDGDTMGTAQELPKPGKRESVRLTDPMVRSLELPAGKSDYTFFDADVPGFGVRIRTTGKKRYVFVYSHGKRVPLGVVTAMSVAAARKIAAGYYAKVQGGGDPAADKKAAKDAAAAKADTFGDYVERYLQFQKDRLRPRSFRNTDYYLTRHAKALHSKPLTEITRRDVATTIAALTFDGNHVGSGVATKKQVRRAIGALFAWCIGQGVIENNPVIGSTNYETKPRDRALSLEELVIVWRALPSDDFGRIVKLLILTGQRANEIAGLRRGELRGDGIVLPAARVKNDREHYVPLSPIAMEILAEQISSQDADREHLFGRRETAAFANWGKAKADLDATITAARGGKALPHWTIHDLRRSFVTGMNENPLSVPPHIIEAIVNHQSGTRGGVAVTYNRAEYIPERRHALNKWASHLLAAVEGRQQESNVVTMRHGG